MEIEVKRKVKKEVEETITMKLETYYVVRVIQVDGCNYKARIFEKEFDEYPLECEIADVLADFLTKKVFATVNKNFRLVEGE